MGAAQEAELAGDHQCPGKISLHRAHIEPGHYGPVNASCFLSAGEISGLGYPIRDFGFLSDFELRASDLLHCGF